MKKRFFAIVLAIAMVSSSLFGCATNKAGTHDTHDGVIDDLVDIDDSSTTDSGNVAPTDGFINLGYTDTRLDWSYESLAAAFERGEWDGSFISDGSHYAVIHDSTVWIDGCDTFDNPHVKSEDWSMSILCEADGGGVWVENSPYVERWENGRIKERHISPYSYITFAKDNTVYVFGGPKIYRLESDGFKLIAKNVIDFTIDDSGNLLYTNFDHEIRDEEGNLLGSGIHFGYSTPKRVSEWDDLLWILQEAFESEAWDGTLIEVSSLTTGWNGETLSEYEGVYVNYVDYLGIIYVASAEIGVMELTFHTPVAYTDWYYNADLYIPEENYILYFKKYGNNSSEPYQIDTPEKMEVIWIGNDDTLILRSVSSPSKIYRVDATRREPIWEEITSEAVDSNVAYDTLYWMNSEGTVYTVDWANTTESVLFVEDALAVSHFEDEGEGAFMPEGKGNYEAYGYTNVYSPYGLPFPANG